MDRLLKGGLVCFDKKKIISRPLNRNYPVAEWKILIGRLSPRRRAALLIIPIRQTIRSIHSKIST